MEQPKQNIFDPSPLYYYMAKMYADNKRDDNKIIFCNEGGSRAGKTIDAFHLIETFCSHAKTQLSIGIFRNTLKDSREKTYDDFKKYLKKIRGIYNPENARRELTSPDYNLYGSSIEFRGLDEETEQKGYDIVFVNEAMEIDSEIKIEGLKTRCRKMMIFDWNPKYTIHWIFNWENRPNVYFTKTTYKNNKHLEKSIVAEIESKSPWNLNDLHLPKNKRRKNEINYQNNTVDEWHFEVYGIGIRSNRAGLVFPNVTWIDKLPTDVDKYFYGIDFGNTTGIFAMSEGCCKGENIYFSTPVYGSFATSEEITADKDSGIKKFYTALKTWAVNESKASNELVFVCDCAQPHYISDLNIYALNDGFKWQFLPVKKFPGCIVWRIDKIKQFNIHLVEKKHTKHEQENYSYININGIQLSEPEHKHNHGFDAMGYSIQYEYNIIYKNSNTN